MEKQKDKSKSFLTGAAVLAAAGLIAKILGAVFRIPLNRIVGTEGMSYYAVAYPYYSWLLVISSAGLPAAISKLVSERVTYGDNNGAYNIFKVAFKLLLAIGVVTTLLMLVLSKPLAIMSGKPNAAGSFVALAPALFFVSIMCAYRGYLQGLQQMTGTALSQVAEQFIKLVAGLYFAKKMMATRGAAFAAQGALLGVTISEIAGLIVIMLFYYTSCKNGAAKQIKLANPIEKTASKAIIRSLLAISIPITLGASIMPLTGIADSAFILNSLNKTDNLSLAEKSGVVDIYSDAFKAEAMEWAKDNNISGTTSISQFSSEIKNAYIVYLAYEKGICDSQDSSNYSLQLVYKYTSTVSDAYSMYSDTFKKTVMNWAKQNGKSNTNDIADFSETYKREYIMNWAKSAEVAKTTNVKDYTLEIENQYTVDCWSSSAYSIFRSYVTTIINMPAVLTSALAMSLVPAISSFIAGKKHKNAKKAAVTGMKISLILGAPCAVGLIVLAEPILSLLYGSSLQLSGKMAMAVNIMRISAIGVLFLSLVQSLTGVIQGLGKAKVPVKNLVAGGVIKIISMLVLMNFMNIYGAALSTVLCYLVAAVLDTIWIIRFMHLKIDWLDIVGKPLAGAIVMGIFTSLVYKAVGSHRTLGTLISLCFAVAVYAVMLVLLKMLNDDDLEFVPGGKKIAALIYKIKR